MTDALLLIARDTTQAREVVGTRVRRLRSTGVADDVRTAYYEHDPSTNSATTRSPCRCFSPAGRPPRRSRGNWNSTAAASLSRRARRARARHRRHPRGGRDPARHGRRGASAVVRDHADDERPADGDRRPRRSKNCRRDPAAGTERPSPAEVTPHSSGAIRVTSPRPVVRGRSTSRRPGRHRPGSHCLGHRVRPRSGGAPSRSGRSRHRRP